MIVPLCLLVLRQQNLKLNGLFSDNLVLQRGAADPIFGSAAPGATVQITIGTTNLATKADEVGQWQTKLPVMQPGPAFNIDVISGAEKVTLHNVLVGEVWLASGQSNMEFPEYEADDYEDAKTKTIPDVRFFTVKQTTAELPVSTVMGSWVSSAPDSIGHFSAVGLAFANELAKKLQCPIGVINSSWGGTPAEAWSSREALEKDPATKPIIDKFTSDLTVYPARKEAYDVAMQMWLDGKTGSTNQGYLDGWNLNVYNDSDWQTVPAPADTQIILKRDFQGSVWYRKVVNLPDDWYGQPLKLSLGMLSDYDSTYFNGVRVGFTNRQTADPGTVARIYNIAPGLVHKGPNLVAVRVFNATGDVGMKGPGDEMRLSLADDTSSQPLDGDWKFKIEQEVDPDTPRPHLPNGPGNPTSPSELFNAMINPLIPFRIAGAIWYQGEANVGNSAVYGKMFPDLIRDWRVRWKEGPFPFYFVQLPNYLPQQPQPGDSAWANLRDAQTQALVLPHTGMAVAIDQGDANDIHPKNKHEIGRRLSLWALQFAYDIPTVYGSPAYKSMEVKGSRIEVTFSNGSLITVDGKAPTGFALAGDDRKFYWADATVDGSTVSLYSAQVPHPVAVRYAWADNPAVNLVNRSGLPAAPFRTDDWPLKGDLH